MSSQQAFIADGYTERGYVAEHLNMHQAVRFDFRPMLISERMAFGRETEKLRGIETRTVMARWLVRKLKSWDLRDGKGELVPIKEDTLLRLKAKLFERLFSVVSVEEASDFDPDRAEQAKTFDEEAETKN